MKRKGRINTILKKRQSIV